MRVFTDAGCCFNLMSDVGVRDGEGEGGEATAGRSIPQAFEYLIHYAVVGYKKNMKR